MAGRKRGFDKEQALIAAMDVFWKKGFVGASLSDLTQSMGINKPSMYSTFGNKEALFVQATQFYIERRAKDQIQLLHELGVPLKTRLKNYLMSIVAGQCETDHPKGCYIVLCQSEVASGDIPEEARTLLTQAGEYIQSLLTGFFLEDPEAKRLSLNINAEDKAFCLATMLRGTASMARAEKPLANLEYVVDHSLKGIGL